MTLLQSQIHSQAFNRKWDSTIYASLFDWRNWFVNSNLAVRFILMAAWLSTFSLCLYGYAEDATVFDSLRMRNGDYYRGKVEQSNDPANVRWNSQCFLTSLEFPWGSVDSLDQYVQQDSTALPPNPFMIETRSGVAYSGSLRSLDGENLVLDIPQLGVRKIAVSGIRSLLRIVSSSKEPVQVLDPNGWEQSVPSTKNGKAIKWFLKAGEIATDTNGTTITQWANVPELATIDLHVAWEQASPNWWLTLGDPRRMELQVRKMLNKKLLNITLLLENAKDADVLSVQLPYDDSKSLHLKILCDANKGQYILVNNRKILGQLKGNPSEKLIGRQKASFSNTATGIVTLRDFRISNSVFSVPLESTGKEGVAEVLTRSRGTFVGAIGEFDASTNSFRVLSNESQLSSISIDELDRIEFSASASAELPNNPSEMNPTELFALESPNGLRFVGTDLRSEVSLDGAATLSIDLGGTRFTSPLSSLTRVARVQEERVNEADATAAATDSTRTKMKMNTSRGVSTGYVDGVVKDNLGRTMLAWLPINGAKTVAINPAIEGSIEPAIETAAVKRAKTAEVTIQPRNNIEPPAEPDYGRALKANEPAIFLKSGDCFPAQILSGSEDILRFRSPIFDKVELDSNLVRGIRVLIYSGMDKVDKGTRKRLLTLPRMQRKNPPKHLVVSRDGDAVRGRMVSFDEDLLQIEVRGEVRALLMKNIAELIWLQDAPAIEPPQSAEPAKDPKADTQPLSEPKAAPSDPKQVAQDDASNCYQVLLDQGTRLSIMPESTDGKVLYGQHPQLGKCQIELGRVAKFLLGNAIIADAERNRFGKWKLQNAPDPKFVNDLDSNDKDADTPQQRLVGQPAPDFDLAKLDGTPCQLGDFKGRLLIVDFWATWCGPCIEAMPKMVEIAREYQAADVALLMINLEQKEPEIRKLLDRLELHPTVLLDTDGSIAKQYAVQAIPQTVIIDRDGTIAKVFVGGGPEVEAQIRETLDKLLGLKL